MATSTILEPIQINDEQGATVIVEALEAAEHTPRRRRSENTNLRTTDPEAIHRIMESALSHKAVDIPAERISKGLAKRVARYARLDVERNVYSVSAFLIAQFGKILR